MGQQPSSPKPGTTLQVIGAGLPRTGTSSFTQALATLLDGPTYHGGTQITLGHPDTITHWISILRDWLSNDKHQAQKTLHQILSGYAAIADAPGSQLIPELLELYPDAKVVCTVRDPDSWEKSLDNIRHVATLWFLGVVLLPLPGMRHFVTYIDCLEKQWVRLYGERAPTRLTYEKHIRWLEEVVPPERLFFVDVKDGWGPLCQALGKDVPVGVPFPRVNDSDAIDMTAKYHIRRGLVRWVGVFVVIGAVGLGLRKLW
ncbi:hypothetical protein FE257_011826 [Aspergillus nanangensis]|uniref:NAD dependent epimerase/dehydratase n=1 Tax=Aspergillus nanangensis TaxID=2582783 RepID=A0AAD4CVB9_ASPNN|nr:hypothetical protein FE257_011826 [Aspergillus nanangensis]